jgi:uncharacterized protein (TIGR02118 family)
MTSRVERRQLLKAGSVGILAGVGAGVLRPALAVRADAATYAGKAKVVFVLFRRADLSHEGCLAEWRGEQHVSLVKNVPGLRRWVQNHVASLPHESAPDGIGELWFGDGEAMKKAMGSSEMGAAVEDAKRFLDMAKTYALVVDENIVIG